MKAITIYQPYATLIMLGIKRIETRPWGTNHRGQLAIHAGKRWDKETEAEAERIRRYLSDHTLVGAAKLRALEDSSLRARLGMVLGTVVLQNVERVPDSPSWANRNRIHAGEYIWGNLDPGRYAWHLSGALAWRNPAPAVGLQRIWNFNKYPEFFENQG